MHKNFLSYLSMRSKVIFAIESFFQKTNYISLHTPAMASWLIPERHIDVFEVSGRDETKKYLVPSPEIHIKQLLSELAIENAPNVYEFSHSFRKEQTQDSSIHSDEFLMLEWYTAAASLQDSYHVCQELLTVTKEVLIAENMELPVWAGNLERSLVINVAECFERFLGLNLDVFITCENAEEAIKYANLSGEITDASGYDWEDVFHWILVDKIEPKLSKEKPVYLWNYPSRVDTLAQEDGTDSRYSKRWELYIQGVEIANCYVEEVNPKSIRNYMQRQEEKMNKSTRATGVPYNIEYLQNPSLPHYSGVAMGIDRLLLQLFSHENNELELSDISPLSYL